MGIKWMIKKSNFYEVRKSVSKEADSKTLEQLKKEVIAILEKKDSQEYKKAIEHFEKDESKYSRLEKSVTGEWIEKAGYGVGTVRIWKGKKYKKVSTSPTRWVRVFDKNDRGAATSMGKYIAQVKKCNSVEELYQFCMKQRSLFQDENGNDLPIMDKLRSAIDKQSGLLEQGEKVNARMKEYQKEDLAKLKAGNYSFDSFDDFKAEIKKQGNDFRGSKQPNYIGYLSQYNDNYLQQVYDAMPKAEKYDDDKAYEEYQKLLMKENPTDADNSRIGELVKEHYKHSKKEWIGGKGLKELNEAKDDSKVLSNGKTVKEVREQYGIKVDKKETEKETYWIKDKGNNRITSEDAKNRIKSNLSQIDAYNNLLKDSDKADSIKWNTKMNQLLDDNKYLMDRLNSDDRKEMESELDKHKNRSDAMKEKDVKDMSDDELNSAISEREKRIGKLENENIELYNRNFGFGSDGAKGKDYENWLANGSEMKKLQKEVAEYSIERGKRRAAKEDSGTKVNGYGEATNREITSGTYERAQKRKQKEVDRFLGVKKGLLDLIDMLDESEDEETDFEDNDASQPNLFNSPAYKVSAALDSVFGCR